MKTQAYQVTCPAPREVWNRLLKSYPKALISQTPVWIDCICAMGGYEDASRLYETSEGKQLVLPMVRRKNLPKALTSEASLSRGWGMGGIVAPGAVQAEDVAVVLEDLAGRSVLCTSIRPNLLNSKAWATARIPAGVLAIPHLHHVLNLESGFKLVWAKRFDGTRRRNVRKAERSRLVVECDTTGKLVPVFYDLYLRWTDRRAQERHLPLLLARWLARRRDPLRKFQLVSREFGEACRIWVAWLDGQPAAASILLIHGENSSYWRGASDKELAGPTRANDLLQRLMIEDACRAGCRYYDMGESGGVPSLMHFKSKFGALPHHFTEYRLESLPITSVQEWFHGYAKRIEEQLIRAGRRK